MRIWKSDSYEALVFMAVVLTATIIAGIGLSVAAEPKTADKGNALIDAGFRSDVEKIKQLLDEGIDVNWAVSDGYTALLEACTHPRPSTIEPVKLLLARGAKVNVVSNMGITPLSGAISTMADIEIIKPPLANHFKNPSGRSLQLGRARAVSPILPVSRPTMCFIRSTQPPFQAALEQPWHYPQRLSVRFISTS